MAINDYLITEIRKRHSELDAIDRRRAIVEAELRLLDDMARHLNEGAASERIELKMPMAIGIDPPGETAPAARTTHLYPRWACVLKAAVERYPNSITNDEVPRIQQAAGETPSSMEGVRSHVSTQAKAGRYEKVGRGMFRATQAGANVIGIPLGNAAPSSPDEGEPGCGPPRLDINNQGSVEAVDAARKAGGT